MGYADGGCEGSFVGMCDGETVGADEGLSDGEVDGRSVGAEEGPSVGVVEGGEVGAVVGCASHNLTRHVLLTQSSSSSHFSPMEQAGQLGPPQSMSVSLLS